MGQYSIKELEKLSGIKSHTLRIWEQRYNLLSPKRTNTNIRFYGDEDVRKLLQVQVLQELGYKISKIVAMSKAERNEILTVSKNNELSAEETDLIYINKLIEAGMLMNEAEFQKTLDEVIDNIGLKNAFQTVLYKVLIRVGLLWEMGEFSPAQEHFTSCLIRDRIIVETAKLPIGEGKTFILWLPESEEHEIGLLYINFLLRYFEMKVIYLGARVPYSSLRSTIDSIQPDSLYSFVVSRKNIEDFKTLLSQLEKDYPKLNCFWSGAAVKESGIHSNKQHRLIHSIENFFKEIL